MKWKSILNAVLEGLIACDPIAYIYYMDYKRTAEREAALQAELQDREMMYRASRGYVLRPIDGSARRREGTLA